MEEINGKKTLLQNEISRLGTELGNGSEKKLLSDDVTSLMKMSLLSEK